MVKVIKLGRLRRALKASRNEIAEFKQFRYGISRWDSLRQIMAMRAYPCSVARFK